MAELQSVRTAAFPTWIALFALAAVVWLFLAFSVANPLVISDEYVYLISGRELDRLTALATAQPSLNQYDNFLFLRLIAALNALNLPDTAILKALNVSAFLLGSALLFCAAVTDRSRRATPLLAALLLSPLGAYAGFIMPESLYGLAFLLLFVVLLRSGERPTPALLVAIGGMIAALSLLKQHGLLVFVAIEAALVVWSMLQTKKDRLAWLCRAGIIAAVYLASTAVGAKLLAPHAPHHELVGPYYRTLIGQAFELKSLRAALTSALIYLDAMLLLLGPSLVFICWSVRTGLRRQEPPPWEYFPALFLLVLLLLLMTSVGFILASEPDRIHLRFLNFAFPAVLAMAWRLGPESEPAGFRILAAGVWVAALAAFILHWSHYRPSPIDSPELFFAYTGNGFGAFGLGKLAPLFGLLTVAGGAVLILRRELSWFHIQLCVLAVIWLVSVWNVGWWEADWSAKFAPLRSVGKAAATLCGSGPNDIWAIGATDRFTDVFQGLETLGRPIPFRVLPSDEVSKAAARLSTGACVMTPQMLDPARFQRLYGVDGLTLYRASAQAGAGM